MFWNPLGRPILIQWCTNNQRVAFSMEIIHVIQRKAGISNLWLDTVDGPKTGYPVDIYYKRYVIKCSVFATQFRKYVLYILYCVFVTPFLQPAYNLQVSNLLCCRVSITRDLSRHWTLKVWFGKQRHFAHHPQKKQKNTHFSVECVFFLDSLAKRPPFGTRWI